MRITVFTPTFNRAYIIEQLYESLGRQSFHDFEWLVVDDGSTDETKALFSGWCKRENRFPIRYYRQENGGKCSAINKALDLAKGELFFTVDSDDYLTDDALQKIDEWERKLPGTKSFCGVAGNLGRTGADTPNTLFPNGYCDGTLLDRYAHVDGERALVFYTDVHKKYKYPIFKDEKFMTEAVAWNRMANDGYSMRFYNDIIWVYDYKEDGLTKAGNSVFLRNPKGYWLWLNEKNRFLSATPAKRFKTLYTYCCDLSAYYETKEISLFTKVPKGIICLIFNIHRIRKRVH